MTKQNKDPDVDLILDNLKDFQRNTVDYVFQRMYCDGDAVRRFLIADEVGLGKTLVARGLIAKLVEHLRDKSDSINVVYICSNADIARQNINRLNISGNKDFALASRITLLPKVMADKDCKSGLKFISFTPGTSFDLKSKLGHRDERALLYTILRDAWNLTSAKAQSLNFFKGNMRVDRFQREVDALQTDKCHVDKKIHNSFIKAVSKEKKLLEEFNKLSGYFRRKDSRPSEDIKKRRAVLIGDLRSLLARICLKSLKPDLVILDEFQRFKDILNQESEIGRLANDLFEKSGKNDDARVLLLSATPYKMYTLRHEVASDDHYKDFMETLSFLQPKQEKQDELEILLDSYRKALLDLGKENGNELRQIADLLQNHLLKVMVRTERLAVSSDRNGMLKEIPCASLSLTKKDLLEYVALEEVATILESPGLMEYWKSSPYLLNFMEDYQLKKDFNKLLAEKQRDCALRKVLGRHKALLFPTGRVKKYRKVDFGNARLRSVAAQTVDNKAWEWLWIPPSMPYYKMGGPFASAEATKMTKRLVFSSWRVVPKVAAALLSYEVERRMITSLDKAAENTPEARKNRPRLLEFSSSEGRLTGMPVLAMLYPCMTLARECDPMQKCGYHLTANTLMSRDQAIRTMESKIRELMKRLDTVFPRLRRKRKDRRPVDERWYWAAPLLLDLMENKNGLLQWFKRKDAHLHWSGKGKEKTSGNTDEDSRWVEHVKTAYGFIEGSTEEGECLGRRPHDLVRVLAQMALGAPGIIALRSLLRHGDIAAGKEEMELRDASGKIAWAFRSLFNMPESIALIRGRNRQEPYWKRVLEYGVDGCLQAVMDEYVHVLVESQGLMGRKLADVAGELAAVIVSALSLRTATMNVDDLSCDLSGKNFSPKRFRMRGHYALRFGDYKSDDEEKGHRPEQVRVAFNSPFRPFVLISTSVGQEGLDFHTYCHAVVHWNLPSNPVDLEQREGRVHRYKGHAIRKNVAKCYGASVLSSKERNASDPWKEVFERAKENRPPDSSDLVPYWTFTPEGGAKIERYLPFLPLSREDAGKEDLFYSLTLYRLVFGQSRQQDMVAYFKRSGANQELKEGWEKLYIDLSAPEQKDSQSGKK